MTIENEQQDTCHRLNNKISFHHGASRNQYLNCSKYNNFFLNVDVCYIFLIEVSLIDDEFN